MPINQNHLFEELDGVKCSIVEKNASKERAEFLRNLLEHNGYTVVVTASPPPKAAPAKPAPKSTTASTNDGVEAPPAATATPDAPPAPAGTPPPPAPDTFTVGVTDLMFNPTNAIFGRLLITQGKRVVTLAYWNQKEEVPKDDVPYFDNKF